MLQFARRSSIQKGHLYVFNGTFWHSQNAPPLKCNYQTFKPVANQMRKNENTERRPQIRPQISQRKPITHDMFGENFSKLGKNQRTVSTDQNDLEKSESRTLKEHFELRRSEFRGVGLRIRESIVLPHSRVEYCYTEENIQSELVEEYRAVRSKENISSELNLLNDEAIIELTKQLTRQSILETDSEQFNVLWDCLTKEICTRLPKLSMQHQLLLTDMFYVSGCSGLWDILYTLSPTFTSRLDTLSPSQVTQFVFYFHRLTSLPEVMEPVEQYVDAHVSEFSVPQLSTICFSFFTSRTMFRSFSTMHSISQAVMSDFPSLELPWLTNVLKSMRMARYYNQNFYEKLSEYLLTVDLREERLIPLSHVAHTYASVGFKHTQLFDHIAHATSHILKQSGESTRIKDLSRILWAFATLGEIAPDSLAYALMDKMRSNMKECYRYPMACVEAMVTLVVLGHYPKDLLSHVLSPQFKANHRKISREQNYQFLLLDYAVRFMCSDYQGYFLPDKVSIKRDLSLTLWHRNGLAPLVTTLQGLLPRGCLGFEFALKFSKIPDIILHIDRDSCMPQQMPALPRKLQTDLQEAALPPDNTTAGLGIMQTLLEESNKQGPGLNREHPRRIHLVPTESQSVRKLIIRVLGWNQFCQNAPVLNGQQSYEITLLQQMGFEVFTILPDEGHSLKTSSKQEREDFVINTVLKPLGISYLQPLRIGKAKR